MGFGSLIFTRCYGNPLKPVETTCKKSTAQIRMNYILNFISFIKYTLFPEIGLNSFPLIFFVVSTGRCFNLTSLFRFDLKDSNRLRKLKSIKKNLNFISIK